MEQKLTDRAFWAQFWESKNGLIFDIKADYVFGSQLRELVRSNKYTNAIELGGFPGYYSVYLKKHLQLETTLFDYFIHPQLVEQLLLKNGLKSGDIRIIESDLFTHKPQQTFDLVSSFGLIEHFTDTRDIINRHLNFLKPGGSLFITLPNFCGINGWVQRRFDPENYSKHYIECMDLNHLKQLCEELGLKEVRAEYFGGFSIWLENKNEQPLWVKAFTKALWFVGKVWSKIFRFESKALSPYIVLVAKKA